MRILALVPGSIGDQIQFFPTLDDLKATYPDAQIDVVVEPRSQSAYRVSKSVGNTILFDFKGGNSLADWGNLLGVLRDREYDIALAFGQKPGVGLLLWLAGISTRIGFGNSKNLFLTQTVPLATQHSASAYHDLLQGLGIDKPLSGVEISVPSKDLEWADSERKRLGTQNGYVLIYPGAVDQSYPIESWQKIIQDFQQRQPELPIVLIKEEDSAIATQLVQACPGVKTTTPENVGQLAALIAGASLMLCTESDPMQIAIAVQTFTLALFGATDPEEVLPKSDRIAGIKSPTGKIADIAPQTVLDRVWGG